MKKEKETGTEHWTVGAMLDWTEDHFSRSGVGGARGEAEYLLSSVLRCGRTDLFLKKEQRVSALDRARYRAMVQERARRIPAAYVLGNQEFMGLTFKVTRHTLIPRPETELMVEAVLALVPRTGARVLADIGTGSGNIAVSIARNADIERIYAVDIDLEALRVAHENSTRHGTVAKVIPKQGDLLSALGHERMRGMLDIIVTNPPYVARDEFAGLEPELSHEPRAALDGGEDGLDFYRRIAPEAKVYLKPGGFLVAEMHSGKSAQIQDIIGRAGFVVESVGKDYAQLDRFVVARQGTGVSAGKGLLHG